MEFLNASRQMDERLIFKYGALTSMLQGEYSIGFWEHHENFVIMKTLLLIYQVVETESVTT